MTAIKEQPGARAVVLLREETDDNMNNSLTVYQRIKILTEAGREFANVELPSERPFSINSISGRTVHADGSILRFEGKPFDKTVAKADGTGSTVKVFTLPGVEVGSIIDFRYSLRYVEHRIFAPEWQVQTDLFQRKAYFKFIPLQNRGFVNIKLDHGQFARGIAWAPFLGNGPQPEMHKLPANSFATVHDIQIWFDLNMSDIPPLVEEPHMPPASLLKWRVYFYYQSTLKPEDYWKEQGKYWNKEVETFVEKNKGLSAALTKIVSPSDPAEKKVRQVYSFVSALKKESEDKLARRHENTLEYQSAECVVDRFSQCIQPEISPVEEKKISRGAEDVLEHGGGTHNDLNRLFVAMLRATGIPASVIWVPDRSEQVFTRQYLSTDQLDGEIAIVPLDGKDVFLDPGTKFCPYGMVDWRYTSDMGLRQSTSGADFGETPALDYKQSLTTRMAKVAVDESGQLSGVASLAFTGVPAMTLRQLGEKADADGRKKILVEKLGELLRGKGEIELANSPDWEGAEPPLVVQFRVRLPLTLPSNQQLLVAQHLFQVGQEARFPASERANALDFRFPWQESDEVHIKIPAAMKVASLAPDDSVTLAYARYRVLQKQEAADTMFSRRDFIMGSGLILPDKYKEVKAFFDKVKADDDQTAVVMLGNVSTVQ